MEAGERVPLPGAAGSNAPESSSPLLLVSLCTSSTAAPTSRSSRSRSQPRAFPSSLPTPSECLFPRQGKVDTRSGEIVHYRCGTCSWCIGINAFRTGRAIATSRPTISILFTRVDPTFEKTRRAVTKFRALLVKRHGVDLKLEWTREFSLRAKFHVHALARVDGGVLTPGVFQDCATRAGLKGFNSFEPIRNVSAVAQYVMKGAKDNPGFHLMLNGGRLVHSSQGFWLDTSGAHCTLRKAKQSAFAFTCQQSKARKAERERGPDPFLRDLAERMRERMAQSHSTDAQPGPAPDPIRHQEQLPEQLSRRTGARARGADVPLDLACWGRCESRRARQNLVGVLARCPQTPLDRRVRARRGVAASRGPPKSCALVSRLTARQERGSSVFERGVHVARAHPSVESVARHTMFPHFVSSLRSSRDGRPDGRDLEPSQMMQGQSR
jgi:hypothetical protein